MRCLWIMACVGVAGGCGAPSTVSSTKPVTTKSVTTKPSSELVWRLTYRVDRTHAARAVEIVRARLALRKVDATVRLRGSDRLIVDFAKGPRDRLRAAKRLIERPGVFAIKLTHEYSRNRPVEGRDYPRGGRYVANTFMEKVVQLMTKDPEARRLKILANIDTWVMPSTSERFRDAMLGAEDREVQFSVQDARRRGCYNRNKPVTNGKVTCLLRGRDVLEEYLRGLHARHPEARLDADHELVYEVKLKPEYRKRPVWRSYYVYRKPLVSNADIARVRLVPGRGKAWSHVEVQMNAATTKRFGELTGRHFGRKLVVMVDGEVMYASVLSEPVTDGRATVFHPALDRVTSETHNRDLHDALKTGPIPGGLHEERSDMVLVER